MSYNHFRIIVLDWLYENASTVISWTIFTILILAVIVMTLKRKAEKRMKEDRLNNPKREIVSVAVAANDIDECENQEQRVKFNEYLKDMLEHADTESVRKAITTIINLPDKDDDDFDFKVWCWNKGNFRTFSELKLESMRLEDKKFLKSEEYRKYMSRGVPKYFAIPAITIVILYFIGTFSGIYHELNPYDRLFSTDWIYDLNDFLEYIISPASKMVFSSTPFVLLYLAKSKISYAELHDAKPDDPYLLRAKSELRTAYLIICICFIIPFLFLGDKIQKEGRSARRRNI